MTMGPGAAGGKVGEIMGRVGNWLGGCLSFPLDWRAYPWKWLLLGAGVIWLAFAVYAGWLWLQ